MQERREDPGEKEKEKEKSQRMERAVPDELQGLEGSLESNVQGNARSCRGARSPGGCGIVGTPRGCGAEGKSRRQQGNGETRHWNQLHHPLFLFSAPTPRCRSTGDVLPLILATVLLQRAAGWQQSQVDVFVCWMGKLEKCELDTLRFMYS